MFKVILLTFVVSLCQTEEPGTTTNAPFLCGVIPNNLYKCLGNPKIIKPGVAILCGTANSECEKMKCIFRKSGWLDGETVNKARVASHFEEFGVQHPAWASACQHVKNACLTADLPAQGAYVSCPAYDVMHCALNEFVRHAQPAQWSREESCSYPRQFAARCPLCPGDCFVPLVPYGTCQACLLLPRQA